MGNERITGLIINIKKEKCTPKKKFILELVLVVIISPFLILSFTRATTYTTIGNNIDTAGSLTVAGNTNIDSGTLFVDSATHQVGIGTTSPITPLTVNGDISSINQGAMRFYELSVNGTNYAALMATSSMDSTVVWTLPAADGSAGQMLTTNSSGNLYWSSSAGSGTVNSGLAGQLAFYNSNGTAVSGTSTLFVSDNGNVGIGNANPEYKLQISGVTQSSRFYAASGVGGPTDNAYSFSGAITGIYSNPVNTLAFSTNSSTRVFINPSGNVGIGTTSPEARLEVTGTAGNGSIRLDPSSSYGSYIRTTAGTNYGFLYLAPASDQVIIYDNSQPYSFSIYNVATEAVKLNSNGNSFLNGGNVGIGTTSPGAKLEIVNTDTSMSLTSDLIIRHVASGNGNGEGTGISFRTGPGYEYGRIAVANDVSSGGSLRFYTKADSNVTEKLRLGSTGGLSLGNSYVATDPGAGNMIISGNVGIGTTSPGTALDVVGNIRTSSRILMSDWTDVIWGWDNNGATIARLVGVGGAGGYLGAYTNGSEKMRITGSGHVGIGTTSPYAHLTVWSSGTTTGQALNVVNSASTSLLTVLDNGNVGIGTMNPGYLLDVQNGAINITAGWSYDVGGISVLSNSSNVTQVRSASGGSVKLTVNGTNDALYINSSGNVGIGTTSPSANLTLSNGTNNVNFDVSDGNLTIKPLSAGYAIKLKNPSDTIMFQTVGGTSNVALVPSTGNVGIGTTSAGALLTLGSGSILHTQTTDHFTELFNNDNDTGWYWQDSGDELDYYINNSNRFWLTGTETGTNNIFHSYANNGNAILLGSDSSEGGDIKMYADSSGNPQFFIDADATSGNTGMYIMNGNVGIGTTSPYAKLTVWSSGTTTGQALNVVNNASTSLLTVLDNGNVGIGTVAPGAKLDLGANSIGVVLKIHDSGATDSKRGFGLDLSGNNYEFSQFFPSNTSGRLSFGTYNGTTYSEKMVVKSGGNIGIGSTSPSALLTVQATNGNGTTPLFMVASSTAGTATATAFYIAPNGNMGIGTANPTSVLDISSSGGVNLINASSGGSPKFIISQYGQINFGGIIAALSGDMKLQTNWIDRMAITNAGNVGIGTTSPYAKLTVWSSGTTTGQALNVVNSASTSLLTVLDNGNVGIGTGNPVFKLEINGTLAVNGGNDTSLSHDLFLTRSDFDPLIASNGGENTGLRITTVGTGKLQFLINYNEKMRLDSNGNFGIGTTSPYAKLSIAGSAGGTDPLFAISTSTASFATSTAFIIDANGNVGIGNPAPQEKLQVSNGNVYVDTIGKGVILRSPDGTCYLINMNNGGSFATSSLACP